MRIFLLSLMAFIGVQAFGQQITHGPLVGGVTEQSARVYIATDVPIRFELQYALDSNFISYDETQGETFDTSFLCTIVPISGLQTNTRYYYRIKIGSGYSSIFTFKTFPLKGEKGIYRIVAGSCNYNTGPGGGQNNPNYKNDLMFQSMVDFDPNIVLHLGDWGYPPSELGAYYNTDPEKRATSFKLRYKDYNMLTYVMPNIPIDYIYDDDYTQNGNAGWTFPVINEVPISGGQIKYELKDLPLPNGVREGAVKGYFDNFPGYPQQDTGGIYHKFSLGNIDIFMLDTRGIKSPVHEPFKYNSFLNTYSFVPNQLHSTLGRPQMDWLKEGLKNSTADWKLIVSGVVFNKKMNELLPLVLAGQLIDRSLIEYAATIAYMWGGYPKDLNELLSFIKDQDVKNVIVVSGDTHSCMMDDGKNAGLPEISTSGWSANNEAYLNGTIDSLLNSLGLGIGVKDFLWNQGGNGVGNNNYNDAYTTLEFFGADSMKACVIDEYLNVISCMTIPSKSIPTGISLNTIDADWSHLYPNPVDKTLNVLIAAPFSKKAINFVILGVDGKRYNLPVSSKDFGTYNIETSGLAKGSYFLIIEADQQVAVKTFEKQ